MPKKIIRFKKLKGEDRVKIQELSRNPSLDTKYIRRLRGYVMNGYTIKQAQTLLRKKI